MSICNEYKVSGNTELRGCWKFSSFQATISSVSLPLQKQARFLFHLQAGKSTGSSFPASQLMRRRIGPGLEDLSLSLATDDSWSQSTTSDSDLSDIGGCLKPRSVYNHRTQSVDFNERIKKNHTNIYRTYLKTNEIVTAVKVEFYAKKNFALATTYKTKVMFWAYNAESHEVPLSRCNSTIQSQYE